MAIKRALTTRAYLFRTNIKGESKLLNWGELVFGKAREECRGKTHTILKKIKIKKIKKNKKKGQKREEDLEFSEASSIARPLDYWLGKEPHESIHA